ncbi:DNA polymerase-4 [Proteiniborus ethanoligenes]|uniref:DNA polymerase IV n=1 Tax=Proteiniborus ethanoligenes TaxID=415015 RepID=A0A1H3PG41_9FIRM|nr:DNA polymerase IV [Proteiniborus ethanoligenes]SDY99379.1 DNA polymerase-4 [Proteiniborus ethanoligenes]
MIPIYTSKYLGQAEKLHIIHVDMDAFYASVEEHDNPKLKGLPIIVGGLSNHGIVTTANYIARKYGVHSAMPIFMAKQKCPRACFLPVRMERYKEVSRQVFHILYGITDLVEPLSIDEAYLDVSNIEINPIEIAQKIKEEVMKKTGLTMSIGISYNKFLAKLASDWNKPNGLKIITEDMVPSILLPLPVKSVYGIGKKTSKRLNNIGIYTVEDLMRLSEEFMVEFFGKSGIEIYNRIRGIDSREVNTTRERKSLGTERTFSKYTKDKEILKDYLHRFALEIEASLQSKNLQAKTITLKIKDIQFRTQTKSKTLNNYISSYNDIFELAVNLLDEIRLTQDIRLIGLTASNLITLKLEQLSLFD